jgi:hypothetical protein
MPDEKENSKLNSEALSAATGGKGPETAGEGSGTEAELKVFVKVSGKHAFSMKVKRSDRIWQVKDEIAAKSSQGAIPHKQRNIIYCGKILNDNYTIDECGITDYGTLHF